LIHDTYGHQAGDNVLTHLAKIVLSIVRVNDIAVRSGGEVFIILLPEKNIVDAKKLAERIRKKVETSKIVLPKKEQVQYTISIGVATYPKHGKDKKSLLLAVDKALYQAKKSGRNQVR
jgi:diguanylate cyclase (GGDEF)-like protein